MQISILIPAYNEEKTIGRVVKDFKKQVPEAKVYVCDNNSDDKTAEIAKKAGACVLNENKQGKGYALRKLFNIESDIFVIVDGDNTYPPYKVKELIKPIIENKADMVIGARKRFNSGFVRGAGNFFITKLINLLFKQKLHDALSGYRVFNSNSLKNLNLKSKGFEIEAEITIKAIENNFRVLEILIEYKSRKDSKLKTFKDGLKIFKTIINLFIHYHPIKFFDKCICIISLFILFVKLIV